MRNCCLDVGGDVRRSVHASSPAVVVAHSAIGRLPDNTVGPAWRFRTSPAADSRARVWYTLTRERAPVMAVSTSMGIQGQIARTRRTSLAAGRRRTAAIAL